MKFLNDISKRTLLSLLIGSTALFTACTDKESEEEYTGNDAFVLTLAYAGANFNYDYYTVRFDDIMSGSLSAVGKGYHQLGYFSYDKIGDQIFSTGGLGTAGIVRLTKGADGSIREVGGGLSFDNSLQDVIEAEDQKLVGVEISSNSDVVKLHIMEPGSVTVSTTKSIAVSNLTTVSGPSYSGMVQSGNYLYLSYYISDPTTYATPSTDQAQVAVFSYPSLEFVKVMTDDRTGPIGGFGTKSGLIKDDSGNVYALSHSNPANGFSQFTREPAILRINRNGTEFDQNYLFSFNDVAEGKTTAHLIYLGNGKVFAEMNTSDRSEQSTWSDAPLRPAVLDLNHKTINYISNIPEHTGIGRTLASTALYDGNYIYMSIPEEVSTYIYRIDLTNYTAIKGAEVEANFVAGFFKL
ncbi:DUF4374 domain-containing protein [Gaoshiqia sediminis]|uniref:DUF4374 domain-containing protein n=1 Tax=Gaoshiqia sediminis TaxID=2986998 RepID=A0AA41Y7V3_9BACT|nr:DUF4374 domain-containing protein [Gaoshiqia sediminis]MCW0483116.1 DUF4374 domain-containing protein [Gaoshiqia sediminis]